MGGAYTKLEAERIVKSIEVVSRTVLEDALRNTLQKHAAELAAQHPEVQAFVALYESIVASSTGFRDSSAHERALRACQMFLRGGNPLSAQELKLIQSRAKDWYDAWVALPDPLSREVADRVKGDVL